MFRLGKETTITALTGKVAIISTLIGGEILIS
jgi:hypothetical protein